MTAARDQAPIDRAVRQKKTERTLFRAANKEGKGNAMRRAAKQIVICAAALMLFCVVCRLLFFHSYTAHINVHYPQSEEFRQPRIEAEQDIVRLEKSVWHDPVLSVRVQPGKTGEADLRILNERGEEIGFHTLKVGPLGTVYDLQNGGFTGDTAVLVAVTAFWMAVCAIMVWHYFQAKESAYYAYSTIYFAGFSLFALSTALLMLRVTVAHLARPADYSMFAAYSMINGASREFMTLTMPAMVAFAAAMAASNIALLRHQKVRLQNVLGLLISGMLVAGEALGYLLFSRNFMGSEWEGRIQSTLENVYATVFVYFECMLVGSAICGLHAARHQPAPDKDFIVILGCWFRRDGTLPPLLRGRVDRALDFWRHQRETTGKEAVLIPSGGQGKDESMPEAEAIRRYLVSKGVPEEKIYPETQSGNTYQNMAFSLKIMQEINPAGKTVYATTNYHVFRSGLWANLAGLRAEGIGGKTKWWFWPNAFMRECVGLLLNRWKQEILLMILLILFFGILSMVL